MSAQSWSRAARTLWTMRSSAEQVRSAQSSPACQRVLRAMLASSKGKSAEGDVEGDAVGVLEEEDAVAEGVLAGIGTARGEGGEQGVGVFLVVDEVGEEGKIGVLGVAGLSPALDGQSPPIRQNRH